MPIVSLSLKLKLFHFCAISVGPVLGSANMFFYFLKHSFKNTINVQSHNLTALPCSIVFLFQSCQKMSVIPRKEDDPYNTWNMPVLQTDVVSTLEK